MGNTQLIDELVSPEAKAQIDSLKQQLADLGVSFNSTAKQATEFYKATGNSSTYGEFVKNNKAAADAIDKTAQSQEKARLAEIKLQQAREKAFDDYEKKLKRQSDLQARAEAKKQADDKKATDAEIKNSEARSRQALKEAEAKAKANRPYNQALSRRNDARKNFEDTALSQGVDSQAAKDALEVFQRYQKELDNVNEKTGNFRDKVGGYANAITSTVGKAFGFIRTLAYILPGIGIAGIFSLIGDAIVSLVKDLDLFNTVSTQSELRAKGLLGAFASSEFSNGVQNIEKLKVNIDLAKKGIANQDEVVKEYNDTLGKTFGYVENLTQAQQGLVNNSDAYIKAITAEAAANILLQDSAKKAAETEQANEKIREQIQDIRAGGIKGFLALQALSFKTGSSTNPDDAIKGGTEKIAENNKKQQEEFKNNLESVKKFLADKNGILSAAKGGSNSTPDADLKETLGAIGYNKKLLQSEIDTQNDIVNNDQESYKKRLSALDVVLKKQKELSNLSKLEELTATDLTEQDRGRIIDSARLDQQRIEIEYNKKRRELLNQELQDIRDKYKSQLDAAKATEQEVFNNLKESFEKRKQAISTYQKEATSAIDREYKAEVKLAGNNKERLAKINEDVAKQRAEVNKQVNQDTAKLQEEAVKDFQSIAKNLQQQSEASIQESLNANLLNIEDNKAKETLVLSEAYKKGEIDQKQYNDRIRKINNDAALQRIQDELDAANAIYAVRNGLSAASSISGIPFGPSLKDVADAKNRVGQLKTALAGQKAANNVSDANSDKADKIKKANEVAQAIGYAANLEADAQKLINAGYQEQIALLEQKKQAIQDNASIEIAAINSSLASEKSKQDQIALVNARTKAKQEKITQEENKVKRKQAVLDKAFNIASIIQNTAVAITKTLAEGGFIFGVPLVPVIAGLGAAELALAAAQPIPAYAKGTKDAKGGLSLVGELGKEFVRTPTGQVFFTPPTASLMDIPKGSEILNAMETKRLQNAGAIPKSEKDDRLLEEVRRGNSIAAKNKPKATRPVAWQTQQSAIWQAYERSIFR